MSTLAIIAFIELDNSVKYVDLVNDGDLAGKILAENYNSYTSAKAITNGGTISILKPALQNCVFHAFNWGRELKCVETDVNTLLAMADVIGGTGEDASPIYVFDGRVYYYDFTETQDWHYHKMYNWEIAAISGQDQCYWQRLDSTGKLVNL